MAGIRAVLFDFDGTISTLRAGWERIMKPFMLEAISGSHRLTQEREEELALEIDSYIDRSTGIQTIYQMKWLADTVRAKGWNADARGEWEYKAEYNRRLLEQVREKTARLARGELKTGDFLMKGSAELIRELDRRGIDMYIASGTDHSDVVREAEVLGVASYMKEIAGAPAGRAECSKEKVLQRLIGDRGIAGHELAVIGDGKVEIRLGKEAGGLAIGLASDEERREGVNSVKERRLAEAGADWIAGDFADMGEWLVRLGLERP